MKVAVYYSNSDVRIEERPVPRISSGEILVRMMASGICGTDVMQWYRQQKGPRVLGHEMAGEIVETSGETGEFRTGDRVFVSHHVPCYTCRYCLSGDYTACGSLHAGNYDPGGFAEFIRVPEQNVRHGTLLLPETMTYDVAAMIEPLACVLLGQRQLDIREGQTVLIIGSGISGLLHVLMAKLKGAKVFATDLNKYRLAKALEFGADHVFDAASYTVDAMKSLNGGNLAERVIVCAGAKQAVEGGIASVDRKGRILFFAVPATDIVIPSLRFWRDEISISFSYGAGPQDLREAMGLIGDGRVDAGRMITHRLGLSDIQNGFRIVSEAGSSLKVVITPDRSTE